MHIGGVPWLAAVLVAVFDAAQTFLPEHTQCTDDGNRDDKGYKTGEESF